MCEICIMLEAGHQSIQSIQLQLWRKSINQLINQSICAEQKGVQYCMASTIPGFQHDKFNSPLNKTMKTKCGYKRDALSLSFMPQKLCLCLPAFWLTAAWNPSLIFIYLFIYLFMLWAYYIGHIFFLFLGAKFRTKVK